MMGITRSVLASTLLLASPERVEMRFTHSVGGQSIGTESATIVTDPAAGTRTVTTDQQITLPGQVMKMKTALRLKEPGGELLGYTLEADAGGVAQKLAMDRTEGQLRFRAQAAGQEVTKELEALEPLIALDNMVGAHLALLVDRFAEGSDGGRRVQAVVPQAMAVVPAMVTRKGTEKGKFGGAEIEVQVFEVQLATVVETVRASAKVPGHLLEVDVPLQRYRILREGFERVAEASAPAGKPAGVLSEEVKIGSGDLALGATLTLPAERKGKIPGLVLVHGSGPNDRDETIAGNKPFRDIAEGLAARGIAVLRYDKRTMAWKGKVPIAELVEKTATLESEVVEDAVAAARLLTARPEVKTGGVFVLGHSLGGFALPYVLRKVEGVTGGIVLAGTSRPIDEVLLEQTRYLLPRQGMSSEAAEEQIAALTKTLSRMRSGDVKTDELILGAPARYWRDLLAHDPASEAAKLPHPLLFLFAGKDYQVTSRDAERWREACAAAGKENVTFKTIAGLNHLFMRVEGESDGSDYQRPGKVATEVIDEIASWILGRAP